MDDMRGYNKWTPVRVEFMPKESGGRKDDSTKPPLSLIPRRALIEEAKALDFGRKKYDSWNWSKGMLYSRVLSALLRHAVAYGDGETTDPETGLSHMAHVRCCAGFLLDYEESHPELNDLRPRNTTPKGTTNESTPVVSISTQLQLGFVTSTGPNEAGSYHSNRPGTLQGADSGRSSNSDNSAQG